MRSPRFFRKFSFSLFAVERQGAQAEGRLKRLSLLLQKSQILKGKLLFRQNRAQWVLQLCFPHPSQNFGKNR